MSEISHPNLIQILDYDPDSKWFVARFYPNGALSQNLSLYKGNILAALKAFRPMVEGVVKIHEAGFVHRDINPRNIFIEKDWSLILGDFGLVFFDDDDRTRLSNTFENVGSRDSMPGWASGIRIDDINPKFDIYSLGKLLWSMISGIPVLQREYWNTESNDLTKIFPDNIQMTFVNNLLASCVVESEEDCLDDSAQFLDNIDTLIENLESHVQPISENIERKCFTCGKGIYKMKSDGNQGATQNMGFLPTGSKRIKIYACDNCGHMQLFYLPNGDIPPAWLEELGEN
ncbi:MAG: protein kinase family protein [Candidatus Marinimicrobia bacterium]|nr:protein kinase family protein [Candidatus Neomarinimicrobiota bacterium]